MIPFSLALTHFAGSVLVAATAGYALLAALAALIARTRLSGSGCARLAVSVLKPLHGMEPRLYENLRSFCLQDHPNFQLVLGVRDTDDPALGVAERLRREFPALDIVVVADGRVHGSNYKVSNLANIAVRARHDTLVLADSDISVGPDYLRRVTAPLNDPEIGLVTCLYRGRPVGGFWSRLGALFIDEWFAPSVQLTQMFGSHSFAFGATIALRRRTLEAVGGFVALADHLADDHRLGELIRCSGLRTVLSDYIVDTDVVETRPLPLLRHELRWLRTIRTLQPAGYALMFVSFGLPLAFLGTALAGWTTSAQWLLGATIAGRLILHLIATREHPVARLWAMLLAPLLPLRDALSLSLWLVGFFGHQVTWAGREFDVDDDGLFRDTAR